MSLTTYVASYDEVRALLGVSDEELADVTIGLRVFLRSLEESFNEIDEQLSKTRGSLIAEFSAVSQIENASRTEAQQRFFDNVQAYSSYYVANDLAGTLPQFSPKTITDGKAMVQRHADGPYKVTIDAIRLGLGRATARLKRAYQVAIGDTPTSAFGSPISPLMVSSPDSDPVTGA